MSETIPLGEVVDVFAGQPAPKPNEFSDHGYPFIRAGSLESLLKGSSENDCEKVSSSVARNRRLKLFPKDTVIFAKSGMSAKIGRIYRLRQPSYVVSHLATLVPTGKYDPSFLTHWLRWHPPSDLINDNAYPSIRISAIAGLKVPNLPIYKQRRISAILDKTDTIRHKREQTLFLAHNLLKSVFLEMFGNPLTNSKQFPTIALGDLIRVSSGNGLTAKDMNPSGPYPVYGGNGISGFHSEYMFDDPQLVIGRVGIYCGAVHATQPKSWVTDNALYIREYKRPVNLTYLEWALRFADLNQYANQAAQPLISGSRIYPIEILFPSELEQDTFAAYVERQKRLLNHLEASCKKANDLFASLSQRAFRGDL
ncbi:MAG: restriction endonuclease subunit S [Candidatus Dadabacteria bacterium]|nr:restriction endonuclease subunit S [Candidatus Dadabacteria bacterium]MDE0476833.1 restriction endonuclease subunit S [Candidatus Dadabacteria bacterium]